MQDKTNGPADSLRQIAQTLNQLLQTQGREDPYRNFRVHDPPTFTGDQGPIAAESWLGRMEEIFRVMQCTDAEKVTLTAYKFDGEAAQWWLGYRANMEANQRQLTWAQFKTLFLDKYFYSTLRDQKEVEFLSLQQGNMTISEYVAKFENLARFSNNLLNQTDDIWKCKRFEQGLRPELRNIVTAHRIRDYQQLIEACQLTEHSLAAVLAEKQARFLNFATYSDTVMFPCCKERNSTSF